MMIGPEPMTRTFLISERLGTHVLPDEFEKPVVQELGIRGARPSLGMELHRECRQRPVPDPLHGAGVRLCVRDLAEREAKCGIPDRPGLVETARGGPRLARPRLDLRGRR